jgi:hypothetical protein
MRTVIFFTIVVQYFVSTVRAATYVFLFIMDALIEISVGQSQGAAGAVKDYDKAYIKQTTTYTG